MEMETDHRRKECVGFNNEKRGTAVTYKRFEEK